MNKRAASLDFANLQLDQGLHILESGIFLPFIAQGWDFELSLMMQDRRHYTS